MESTIGTALGIILIIGEVLLYFLPTILAFYKKRQNVGLITVLNLFFGWTIVIWILCLVMVYSEKKEIQTKTK